MSRGSDEDKAAVYFLLLGTAMFGSDRLRKAASVISDDSENQGMYAAIVAATQAMDRLEKSRSKSKKRASDITNSSYAHVGEDESEVEADASREREKEETGVEKEWHSAKMYKDGEVIKVEGMVINEDGAAKLEDGTPVNWGDNYWIRVKGNHCSLSNVLLSTFIGPPPNPRSRPVTRRGKRPTLATVFWSEPEKQVNE